MLFRRSLLWSYALPPTDTVHSFSIAQCTQHAEREKLITRNVAKLVQIPTPRYKIGKGLPVSDVKRLLSAAKGTRFYPVYVLAATLGLRRGELLGLRWSDIDFAKNTLQVAQTVQRVSGRLIIDETKTDASDAVVPLPKLTRVVLLEHREHQAKVREDAGELWTDHDLVFSTSIGTPIEPRSLNTHWEGVRVHAGLPGVRLHDLRHTVVSLCSNSAPRRTWFRRSPGMRTAT